MTVNFTIDQNTAIQYDSYYIDLHNCYDLLKVDESISKKEIQIAFKRTIGEWVDKKSPSIILFKFINPDYMHIEDGDPQAKIEDQKTLSELTYFPSTHRDMNDGIIDQSVPNENDDILFFFEDGKLIRIACESIKLEVTE